MVNDNIDWTEDRVQRLSALLAEGKSRGEIAKMWGVGRSAIVAKARRMALSGGPPPSMRLTPDVEKKAVQMWNAGASFAAITAETGIKSPTGFAGRRDDCIPRKARPKPTLTSTATPAPTMTPVPTMTLALEYTPEQPVRYGRVTECSWPTGEPGTRAFRFCDEASEPGKPYCEDHCKLAYVRSSRSSGHDQSETAA